MGLMYSLPISLDEKDFAEVKGNTLFLRTYGLPYIFWIYLLCALIFYFLICLFSFQLLQKLMQMGGVDQVIAYAIAIFLAMLPMITLGFFFYYREIKISPNTIIVKTHLFFIPIKKNVLNSSEISFEITSHLDSANIAKQNPSQENIGFQNKGYFILFAYADTQKIQIDRSSSKTDLMKIQGMIEKFI